MLCLHRAGADGTERRCVRAAANLEGTAAVVMTVITVLTVIMGIPPFETERKRAGRKSDPAPRNRLQTGLIPAKANLKGQEFWNEME
jgi:hypothetical protein